MEFEFLWKDNKGRFTKRCNCKTLYIETKKDDDVDITFIRLACKRHNCFSQWILMRNIDELWIENQTIRFFKGTIAALTEGKSGYWLRQMEV